MTLEERISLIEPDVIEEILFECNIQFSDVNSRLPTLNDISAVKVINVPSMSDAISTLTNFTKLYFKRFPSALSLHFEVRGDVEDLSEIDLLNLAINFKRMQKPFLIIFESSMNKCSIVYWKLRFTLQIFSLNTETKLLEFVKKFLSRSLKQGHKVLEEWPKDKLLIKSSIGMLIDHRNYNLLFLAIERRDKELVEHLIHYCDTRKVLNGKEAPDIAYEKSYYEILLILLLHNYTFPKKIEKHGDHSVITDGIRRFILTSMAMHDAIKAENCVDVARIIENNPNLRYFYDIHNNSALAVAIRIKAFEIYKLLIKKNLSLGCHEQLSTQLEGLSDIHRAELGRINEEGFQPIADKHILILMSNTNVGSDDKERQNRLTLVGQAFLKLNTVPRIKTLLEAVAATRNFQLTFDFNREDVQFLDPKSDTSTNGVFYTKGKIYIAAKNLLLEAKAHQVLGVIAHELCHYTMFKVFNNSANPYRKDDVVNERTFRMIVERTKALSGIEIIIDLVFSAYSDKEQPAELIVRIPHILAHYIDNPAKVSELEETFVELNQYFNEECIPVIEDAIPEIEKKSESEIQRKYAKPTTFFKHHWKSIVFWIICIIMSLFVLEVIVEPCNFKNCGLHQYAYCSTEKTFFPVCKCNIGNLKWFPDGCYECKEDHDCNKKKVCYNNTCTHAKDIFVCSNKSQRIRIDARCDGIQNCEDGTDESYHCVPGNMRMYEKYNMYTFFANKNTWINDTDYMILAQLNESVGGLRLQFLHDVYLMPIHTSIKFPNLYRVDASQCNITALKNNVFFNLLSLKHINMSHNKIEEIDENSFDELRSLEELFMQYNNLTYLKPKLFARQYGLKIVNFSHNNLITLNVHLQTLRTIENVSFEYNNITKLPKNLFETNRLLKNVTLGHNKIKKIQMDTFTHLALKYIDFSGNICLNHCYKNDKTVGKCLSMKQLNIDINKYCLN